MYAPAQRGSGADVKNDLVIHVTGHTRPAWLARRTLAARSGGRGTVVIGSRSSHTTIAGAAALIADEAPDAIQFRATPVDGPDQVIRWLAPGEQPGPEAATFAYPTRRPSRR